MRESTLHPLVDTLARELEIHIVGVWFLNSIAIAKSFQLQSILVCTHPQILHYEELVARCSLTIA